jgi:hypothetical protein
MSEQLLIDDLCSKGNTLEFVKNHDRQCVLKQNSSCVYCLVTVTDWSPGKLLTARLNATIDPTKICLDEPIELEDKVHELRSPYEVEQFKLHVTNTILFAYSMMEGLLSDDDTDYYENEESETEREDGNFDEEDDQESEESIELSDTQYNFI